MTKLDAGKSVSTIWKFAGSESLDWIYVEKSYNDKLRSKGEADKVIPNRCDNCSDPILLETEGGDICE